MKEKILDNVRQLNWLLQESPRGKLSFDDICKILSDLMDSNVYIVDNDGVALGTYFSIAEESSTEEDPDSGLLRLPDTYATELMKIRETVPNLQNEEVLKVFKYEQSTKSKYHTIIPIIGGGERWGSLILARYEPEYAEADLVVGEVGATIVGIEIQRVKRLEEAEAQRQEEIVNMALKSLSYSEHEAVLRIFEELDGSEGILIASKVADRSRITRSVIVNALRKLESAGVIESKSLGMKGTHIKVLNESFLPMIGVD